jgi:hypothetical protein
MGITFMLDFDIVFTMSSVEILLNTFAGADSPEKAMGDKTVVSTRHGNLVAVTTNGFVELLATGDSGDIFGITSDNR